MVSSPISIQLFDPGEENTPVEDDKEDDKEKVDEHDVHTAESVLVVFETEGTVGAKEDCATSGEGVEVTGFRKGGTSRSRVCEGLG